MSLLANWSAPGWSVLTTVHPNAGEQRCPAAVQSRRKPSQTAGEEGSKTRASGLTTAQALVQSADHSVFSGRQNRCKKRLRKEIQQCYRVQEIHH